MTEAGDATPGAGERTARVLVVDDQGDVADLTATYLERDTAFETTTHTRAADALDALADGEPPDCIVSDHDMPAMDGLEFLAAVRESHPGLPFILFTGKGNEEIASEAVSAGVTDYVKKGGPEQYDILANRVRNAVTRRRSEVALREEKNLLEQVLATTPGSIVCTRDGTVTYATSRAAGTLGIDRDRLVDANWADPDGWTYTDYEGAQLEDGDHPVHEVFETGEAVADAPIAIVRRDGDVRYLSVDAAPLGVQSYDGRVERAVVSFRDVTEQVEHERRLRESEQKYASVVQEANDAVVIAQDGVIKFANPMAGDILNADPVDLVGEPIASVVASEDRDTVLSRLRRRLQGENPQRRYEFTAVATDGEEVPIEFTASVITYEDEPAVLAICRDVSERKQRERELEQYETIVQTAPDGVFIIDEAATYVGGNIPGAELTGYSPEELRGTSVPELVAEGVFGPEVLTRYTETVRHLLSSSNDEQKGKFEFTITQDGHDRIYECHVSVRPFDPEAGEEFRGSIGVLRDVTERKRRERDLERQNERLEEFANVVGHDLRNPLNVATGHLDLARETGDEAAFERVADAHDRIEEILDDLLTLARTGRSVEETEAVHLHDLAERAWASVDTPAAVLDRGDDLAFQADPGRVRQLLENLFANSVEHGSTGNRDATRPDASVEHDLGAERPELSVDGRGREASSEGAASGDGAAVTVTVDALPDGRGFRVADDGPGIPDSVREEVFDPGVTTRTDGTGFGLAIVSDIAEAHGWQVALGDDSNGTVVEVRFG